MTADFDEATRVAELEADDRRLRWLLDQRDAPGELRHRLRNTVSILRVIVRKSAETKRDLEIYVGHLEDRLDALVSAQAAADARGSVELHALLADELLRYHVSEGERALLSGPDVDLQPRAGQILAMAIHELAVNAVEHGALGSEAGRVEVSWAVSDTASEPAFSLVWKELGGVIASAPSHEGFGTEVLTKTLPYELKAETALAFEPDGLRCTIGFPLPARIGQVTDAGV